MGFISQCRPGLGTYVKIGIQGQASDDCLLSESLRAFGEIERAQRAMSFHDPDSELSRINRTAHRQAVTVSPEMGDVLRLALELSRQTDGRFDVCVGDALVRLGALPDHGNATEGAATWRDILLQEDRLRFARPLRIDLGGIAKGFAVDRALAAIDGELSAVVNAGGDLSLRPWQEEAVHIRVPPCASHPNAPTPLLELPMLASSVATSAGYFGGNQHSIISPASRQPIDDRRSVSVFARHCMVADALTKAVFLSDDCLPLLERHGARAVIVDEAANPTYLGAN